MSDKSNQSLLANSHGGKIYNRYVNNVQFMLMLELLFAQGLMWNDIAERMKAKFGNQYHITKNRLYMITQRHADRFQQARKNYINNITAQHKHDLNSLQAQAVAKEIETISNLFVQVDRLNEALLKVDPVTDTKRYNTIVSALKNVKGMISDMSGLTGSRQLQLDIEKIKAKAEMMPNQLPALPVMGKVIEGDKL